MGAYVKVQRNMIKNTLFGDTDFRKEKWLEMWLEK